VIELDLVFLLVIVGPHLLTSLLRKLELAIIISMLKKELMYKEMPTCHKKRLTTWTSVQLLLFDFLRPLL